MKYDLETIDPTEIHVFYSVNDRNKEQLHNLGKMNVSASKAKKRRRLESSISDSSTQTQISEISADSNSGTDTNQTYATTYAPVIDASQFQANASNRRRTVSERQFDCVVSEDGTKFFVEGDSLTQCPRLIARRNTENSVDTQPKQFYGCSENSNGFHKCKTTSCIQNSNCQLCGIQNQAQSPAPNISSGARQYDNNINGWHPPPLRPTNRYRSASSFDHMYISLDHVNRPDFYLNPVDTVVTSQEGNVHTNLVPNGIGIRRHSDSDEARVTDALSSEPSSGYCRTGGVKPKSFGCCSQGDPSEELRVYKTRFWILCVLNVMLIAFCVTGLPVIYHMSRDLEKKSPQGCFDKEELPELGEGSRKFIMEDPSGKYCPSSKIIIQKISEPKTAEACRPAMELSGNWNEADKLLRWKSRRKSCGLSLSADNTNLKVEEGGNYFIYSRIIFRTDGEMKRQEFPLGHRLMKNNISIEKVTQHCRVNQSSVQHLSLLQTTKFLMKGDEIWLKVDKDYHLFLENQDHRLGLFKL